MWFIEYITDHLGEITSVASILGAVFMGAKSIMNSIHNQIQEIRDDTKEANKRIDAMGARIDAMLIGLSTRIDQTQAIIMRMSEKGK